jgi:outer membrane protein assembly factor BamB
LPLLLAACVPFTQGAPTATVTPTPSPLAHTSVYILDEHFASARDGSFLVSLNAATGAERWRFDATGWRAAAGVPKGYFKGVDSLVVVEGTVFFASTAWSGSTKGTPGAAYAVDTRTGTERWHYTLKGSVGGIFGIMLVAGP